MSCESRSYFIEPNPARRANETWHRDLSRYRYASHGLRFRSSQFSRERQGVSRPNQHERTRRPKNQRRILARDSWLDPWAGRSRARLAPLRHMDGHGSRTGTAQPDSRLSGHWLVEGQKGRRHAAKSARYSLVVSIRSSRPDIDIIRPWRRRLRTSCLHRLSQHSFWSAVLCSDGAESSTQGSFDDGRIKAAESAKHPRALLDGTLGTQLKSPKTAHLLNDDSRLQHERLQAESVHAKSVALKNHLTSAFGRLRLIDIGATKLEGYKTAKLNEGMPAKEHQRTRWLPGSEPQDPGCR